MKKELLLIYCLIQLDLAASMLKCGEEIIVNRGEKKTLRFWSTDDELMRVEVIPERNKNDPSALLLPFEPPPRRHSLYGHIDGGGGLETETRDKVPLYRIDDQTEKEQFAFEAENGLPVEQGQLNRGSDSVDAHEAENDLPAEHGQLNREEIMSEDETENSDSVDAHDELLPKTSGVDVQNTEANLNGHLFGGSNLADKAADMLKEDEIGEEIEENITNGQEPVEESDSVEPTINTTEALINTEETIKPTGTTAELKNKIILENKEKTTEKDDQTTSDDVDEESLTTISGYGSTKSYEERTESDIVSETTIVPDISSHQAIKKLKDTHQETTMELEQPSVTEFPENLQTLSSQETTIPAMDFDFSNLLKENNPPDDINLEIEQSISTTFKSLGTSADMELQTEPSVGDIIPSTENDVVEKTEVYTTITPVEEMTSAIPKSDTIMEVPSMENTENTKKLMEEANSIKQTEGSSDNLHGSDFEETIVTESADSVDISTEYNLQIPTDNEELSYLLESEGIVETSTISYGVDNKDQDEHKGQDEHNVTSEDHSNGFQDDNVYKVDLNNDLLHSSKEKLQESTIPDSAGLQNDGDNLVPIEDVLKVGSHLKVMSEGNDDQVKNDESYSETSTTMNPVTNMPDQDSFSTIENFALREETTNAYVNDNTTDEVDSSTDVSLTSVELIKATDELSTDSFFTSTELSKVDSNDESSQSDSSSTLTEELAIFESYLENSKTGEIHSKFNSGELKEIYSQLKRQEALLSDALIPKNSNMQGSQVESNVIKLSILKNIIKGIESEIAYNEDDSLKPKVSSVLESTKVINLSEELGAERKSNQTLNSESNQYMTSDYLQKPVVLSESNISEDTLRHDSSIGDEPSDKHVVINTKHQGILSPTTLDDSKIAIGPSLVHSANIDIDRHQSSNDNSANIKLDNGMSIDSNVGSLKTEAEPTGSEQENSSDKDMIPVTDIYETTTDKLDEQDNTVEVQENVREPSITQPQQSVENDNLKTNYENYLSQRDGNKDKKNTHASMNIPFVLNLDYHRQNSIKPDSQELKISDDESLLKSKEPEASTNMKEIAIPFNILNIFNNKNKDKNNAPITKNSGKSVLSNVKANDDTVLDSDTDAKEETTDIDNIEENETSSMMNENGTQTLTQEEAEMKENITTRISENEFKTDEISASEKSGNQVRAQILNGDSIFGKETGSDNVLSLIRNAVLSQLNKNNLETSSSNQENNDDNVKEKEEIDAPAKESFSVKDSQVIIKEQGSKVVIITPQPTISKETTFDLTTESILQTTDAISSKPFEYEDDEFNVESEAEIRYNFKTDLPETNDINTETQTTLSPEIHDLVVKEDIETTPTSINIEEETPGPFGIIKINETISEDSSVTPSSITNFRKKTINEDNLGTEIGSIPSIGSNLETSKENTNILHKDSPNYQLEEDSRLTSIEANNNFDEEKELVNEAEVSTMSSASETTDINEESPLPRTEIENEGAIQNSGVQYVILNKESNSDSLPRIPNDVIDLLENYVNSKSTDETSDSHDGENVQGMLHDNKATPNYKIPITSEILQPPSEDFLSNHQISKPIPYLLQTRKGLVDHNNPYVRQGIQHRRDDSQYPYGGDSPFFIKLPGSPNAVPVFLQYEPVEVKYVSADKFPPTKPSKVSAEEIIDDTRRKTKPSMQGKPNPEGSSVGFKDHLEDGEVELHLRPDPFFLMEPPNLGKESKEGEGITLPNKDESHSIELKGNLNFDQEKSDPSIVIGDKPVYPGEYFMKNPDNSYSSSDTSSLTNPVFSLGSKMTTPPNEPDVPQYTPFPLTTNPPRSTTDKITNSTTTEPITTTVVSSHSPTSTKTTTTEPPITTRRFNLPLNKNSTSKTTETSTPVSQIPEEIVTKPDFNYSTGNPPSIEFSPAPSIDFNESLMTLDYPELPFESDNSNNIFEGEISGIVPKLSNEELLRNEFLGNEYPGSSHLGDGMEMEEELMLKKPEKEDSSILIDSNLPPRNDEDFDIVALANFLHQNQKVWSSPKEVPMTDEGSWRGPSWNTIKYSNRDDEVAVEAPPVASPWITSEGGLGGEARDYSAFYSPEEIPGLDPAYFSYRKMPVEEREQRSNSIPKEEEILRFIESLPQPMQKAIMEGEESESHKLSKRASTTGEQVYCEWNLKTEPGLYLLVTFSNLSAPYTIDCHGAYIEVERENNGYDARWCGNRALLDGTRSHVIFAKTAVRITVYDNGDSMKTHPTGFEADIEVLDLFNTQDYRTFIEKKATPKIRRLMEG